MKINGSNVCVAGGCGFLGSHLVDYLIEEKDCKVLVLDNLMVGSKEWLHPIAKFEWCDISLSEGAIQKILSKYDIKYAFNYVAMPYVPMSYERPLGVFDINARGALMFMNACQDALVDRILQVSSAEIYGDAHGKINEDYPARPHSSYGASKLAIDCLVQARWKENQTPCIALRQFNCVGERETHPYVIPEIIRQVAKTNEIIFLGNNSARDFLYAKDQAMMATELLEKGNLGEVYNLGSEHTIQIYDLAHIIADLMGKKIEIIVDDSRKRAWEIWHLQSDNTKIYSVIESRPKFTLEQALHNTIEYYREHGWVF